MFSPLLPTSRKTSYIVRMTNVLCVDIGTTSLKTAVIDTEGSVLGFERESFTPDGNGFEAEKWIYALETCARRLSKKCEINAVCISGNGPTLASEDGRTLLWNEKIDDQNIPHTGSKSLFIPRLLFFRKKYRKNFNSGAIFSGPEYLIYRLTGTKITVLPEKRYEPYYWNREELEKAGFTEEEQKKLPPFVFPGFNAGNITESARERLGLPDVPVFAGGPDFAMALVGTNTLSAGKICDRSGSSEGLNFCVEKPVFAEGIRTLPSVVPGLWNLSVLIQESGIRLDRFKDEINALSKKENSWEEIMDYCFSDKNSEGFHEMLKICAKVRNGIDILRRAAEESEQKMDGIMTVTGGQAKSDQWLEEKAVNVGMSLAVCRCRDSELTGDAAAAFFGMGIFKSLEEAAAAVTKIDRVFESGAKPSGKYTIYRIPQNLDTIIFDIDSTLYTSEAYAIEQVDVQIRHFAEKRGISNRSARNLISEFRRNWKNQHGGKKISLGNTLLHFGVSIEESIKMRETLLEPKNFLSRDEKLIQTLSVLQKKFNLICVTNNPVLPAKKTLDALGVSCFFRNVIGLDVCKKSKPAKEPFELAAKLTGSRFERCISIGDRYDMDISIPLALGMGGILVGGVEDVYRLPEILC